MSIKRKKEMTHKSHNILEAMYSTTQNTLCVVILNDESVYMYEMYMKFGSNHKISHYVTLSSKFN